MAEKIIQARRSAYQQYMSRLRPLELKGMIRLPYVDHFCESNGHIFYLLARNLEERNGLMKYLQERGILAVFHYVPLHSSPAGRIYGRAQGAMKITDNISDRLLRLPLYYELTEHDIDRVVNAVEAFFSSLESTKGR